MRFTQIIQNALQTTQNELLFYLPRKYIEELTTLQKDSFSFLLSFLTNSEHFQLNLLNISNFILVARFDKSGFTQLTEEELFPILHYNVLSQIELFTEEIIEDNSFFRKL